MYANNLRWFLSWPFAAISGSLREQSMDVGFTAAPHFSCRGDLQQNWLHSNLLINAIRDYTILQVRQHVLPHQVCKITTTKTKKQPSPCPNLEPWGGPVRYTYSTFHKGASRPWQIICTAPKHNASVKKKKEAHMGNLIGSQRSMFRLATT